MRFAVLSDIHGNLTALEAVLNDVKKLGINNFNYVPNCIWDKAEKSWFEK